MEDLKKEVLAVYDRTESAIDKLTERLRDKNMKNVEEAAQSVDGILSTVDDKKLEFKKRIAELEADSEFEKFTIAFFGQTNAGKSTIIEALRVLFDEEGRKQKIKGNIFDQQQRREERVACCTEVIRRLEGLRKAYRPTPILKRLLVSALLFACGAAVGVVFAWRYL